MAVILVLAAAVMAVPAPAWAHTELLGTSPADAAVMTSSPDEVTLTFSGPVRADGSTVTVTGPDGRSHSDGALSVIDFVVHQPVADLTSGTYRVEWQVVAGDGHPMSGQFTFQLSLPEPEPTPSPTTSPAVPTSESTPAPVVAGDRSFPAWWWIAALLALAVIAVAVLLVLRRARRQ